MTEEHIIAYLLEELSVAEQEQLEDECFAADAWPEELSLAEESLIDDYLRGTLAPARRALFEQNYLITTAREEKVALAAAFLHQIDEQPEQNDGAVLEKTSWGTSWRAFWNGWRWAMSTAALVLVVLGVGLWWRQSVPPSPPTFAVLQLTLTTGTRDTRSGDGATRDTRNGDGTVMPQVTLPLSVDELRVTLPLPPNAAAAKGYRVKMERNDATTAVNLATLAPDNGSLTAIIPAAQLTRGQYALHLYTFDANGQETRIPGGYYFAVV